MHLLWTHQSVDTKEDSWGYLEQGHHLISNPMFPTYVFAKLQKHHCSFLVKLTIAAVKPATFISFHTFFFFGLFIYLFFMGQIID